MAEVKNSSSEEKKAAVETVETLKEIVKPAVDQSVTTPVGISTPSEMLHVDLTKAEIIVDATKQTPTEELEKQQAEKDAIGIGELKPPVEPISNTEGFTNSWGRQDEFQELNSVGSISSGVLKRNSGQEIAGLGVILKSEVIIDGVHSEALVFVPGASIIDLYEDYENPKEISGRTIAKR